MRSMSQLSVSGKEKNWSPRPSTTALSAASSAHEAQRRWSHRTALEALVHGHHGLAELLQIVSHLRIDHLLALNLLTAHVDTARHEVHVECSCGLCPRSCILFCDLGTS